ncbi:hypothetical protein B0T24DRAFT_708613, partial [Lasiosphaeria ovina]
NILVLDCGGGTVDITNYNIRATYPTIAFDEICAGAGGKCGSTYIDRNLHSFLSERFGHAFEKLPVKYKDPRSLFMTEFEKVKHNFGSADNDVYEIGPIPLGSGHKPEYFDEDEEAILLSREDIEEIFDPVIEDIIRLVTQQVAQVLGKKGKHINLIVLVGGFGNSNYLKKVIDKWARPHGIECIRPSFWRGTSPSKVICRRHYGFTWAKHFCEGIDDEKNAYWSFGENLCRGFMEWMIEKGTEIDASTSIVVDVRRVWISGHSYHFLETLYSCNLDNAPEREDGSKITAVGVIRLGFSRLDMSKFQKRETTKGTEYHVSYQFKVDLRTTDGVLRYSSMSGGKTIGVTTIDSRE